MKPIDKNTRHLVIFTLAAGLCSSLLTGCTSSVGSHYDQSSATDVSLSQNNYKVIKSNAIGKDRGFRLLGIIPLAGTSYAKAKKDLYDSIDEDLAGRSIALTNQSEDKSNMYLILFSLPKLTLSADVVEFVDNTPAPAAAPAVAPAAEPESTPAP